MEDPRRFLPSAIKINSSHVASEVTIYNSVDVNHRKNLYNIVLKNVLRLRCIFYEVSHESFYHKG
jgi:hypothetical protein